MGISHINYVALCFAFRVILRIFFFSILIIQFASNRGTFGYDSLSVTQKCQRSTSLSKYCIGRNHGPKITICEISFCPCYQMIPFCFPGSLMRYNPHFCSFRHFSRPPQHSSFLFYKFLDNNTCDSLIHIADFHFRTQQLNPHFYPKLPKTKKIKTSDAL